MDPPPLVVAPNGRLVPELVLDEPIGLAPGYRAGRQVLDLGSRLRHGPTVLVGDLHRERTATPQDKVAAAVASPIMKRYSKSPDHEYDAALRSEVIAKARLVSNDPSGREYQPTIAYKETIRKKATARYRHKKQSGGAGQFADVVVERLPGSVFHIVLPVGRIEEKYGELAL